MISFELPHGGQGGISGIIHVMNRYDKIAKPTSARITIGTTTTNIIIPATTIQAPNAKTMSAVMANIPANDTTITAAKINGAIFMNTAPIIKIAPTIRTSITINTIGPGKNKQITEILIITAIPPAIINKKQRIIVPNIAIPHSIGATHNVGVNKQGQIAVIHNTMIKQNITPEINIAIIIARTNDRLSIHAEMQNALKHKA